MMEPKKSKNKLLIVGGFPPFGLKIFGGVVTSCKALIDSSFSKQFDLILIDSTQISNPPPGGAIRALLALRRFLRFAGQMIARRPNAVLLFTSSGASVLEKGLMAWTSRLFRIPVFVFPRAAVLITTFGSSRYHRFWISCSLKGATHFLCQGPAWQRFATDELGFSKKRAPVIPNWTATNRLFAIGEQRVPKNLEEPLQLLFLGWVEREKGVFELLEACAALAANHPFTLVIAGCGHAEVEARDFVRTRNLDEIVKFVGWVEGDAKEVLLSESDILILPSWAEGLPNAMIEAMAVKIAVVVSAVGNVPDFITDGKEALLVPPRSVPPLQKAIERLLVDKHFREELAERGQSFARVNFAVEPAVAKLGLVIQEAIAECKAP